MLTTADHEGVVATYRALKGLSELGRRRVSLVVLDARDEAHADAVFRKLDAVSRQFLHCGLESESPIHPVEICTELHGAGSPWATTGPPRPCPLLARDQPVHQFRRRAANKT